MKKKLSILVITVIALFAMRHFNSIPTSSPSVAKWHKVSFDNLYTTVNLTIHMDSTQFELLMDSLSHTFSDYTQKVQSNSNLDSIIFNAPVGTEIPLSPVLYDLFAFGAQQFTATSGAINVGIGNLLRAYGLMWDMTPHLPDSMEINAETERIKSLFFELLPESQSIKITRTGEHYALGSFSKGKALDLAVDIFNHFKIERYLLEVGGDILFTGKSPKDKPWAIGIQDPDSPQGIRGIISLDLPGINSMATSGGYQKYFVDENGKKHHHILNPKTGRSIADKKSVSAFGNGGMLTDFWATYLFIVPVDSAYAIVERTENLEAIIIDNHDNTFISEGLKTLYKKM